MCGSPLLKSAPAVCLSAMSVGREAKSFRLCVAARNDPSHVLCVWLLSAASSVESPPLWARLNIFFTLIMCSAHGLNMNTNARMQLNEAPLTQQGRQAEIVPQAEGNITSVNEMNLSQNVKKKHTCQLNIVKERKSKAANGLKS